MSKGAVEALRAQREANYLMNQQRMKEQQGKTVDRPKAVVKKAPKKKPAKSSRKRG